MGYILPISHNSYKNYQMRMQKEKLNVRSVQKTYKVNLEKQFLNQPEFQNYIHLQKFTSKNSVIGVIGKGLLYNQKI